MFKKKIPGDKLLLVFSIFLLAISFILFYGTYEKREIASRGEVIEALVKEAPEDCNNINTNWDGYCSLEYKGKIYVVSAGKKFCSLVSGKEKVEMLINEDKNKMIFLEEYNSSQFGNGVFILLVSLFAIYSSIKSIRLNPKN